MSQTATPSDVILNVGDPTVHAHDWESVGVIEGGTPDAPIHSLKCATCPATGYGTGDFSDAAREARRSHQPAIWTSAGPPDANGVHPIVNQHGDANTCDCHVPNEDGSVTPDPGHEVTA